ncbi:MAG: type II toxin-antitoxin system VapC family toxin [Dehalococcoidia bacterium]|nr:type II toxin-antitoxin system VapC family toxin [Dehalococcoidia bacterium]
MIVSDTSALMALVMDEPEAPDIRQAIDEAGQTLISAATLIEFYIVAMGKGDDVYARAQALIRELPIAVVPFDSEQAEIARRAYEQYGKGRGHPAQLNFGDTFSYALASSRGLPLLYQGGDFARTDIPAAV